MKCFICKNAEMKPYFVKNMGGDRLLSNHQFIRCPACGLVVNQTIYEMTEDEWMILNDGHKDYQGTNENPVDPDWIRRLHAQADVIAGLARCGIVSTDCKAIDYGCGDGKLSEYINDSYRKQTGEVLNSYLVGKYDKYMCPEGADDYYSDNKVVPEAFDLVVSCSVFEHLKGMRDVENILSLVKEDGILATHVLVCEEVPQDPDWFYLLLTHCTIWTNKAMSKLYELNGYKGCAYHVESRMWFFFKDIEKYKLLQEIKGDISGTWVLSDRFVEYWKQKPYRIE